MEEDIKLLEELVNKFKNSIKNEDKENYKFFGTMLFYEDIQAIKNLIARNKKLENITKQYNSYCAEAPENAEYEIVIADKRYFDMGIFEEQFIPKSKVRELYEHYKDTGYYELESVLQELLQEGDK